MILSGPRSSHHRQTIPGRMMCGCGEMMASCCGGSSPEPPLHTNTCARSTIRHTEDIDELYSYLLLLRQHMRLPSKKSRVVVVVQHVVNNTAH